jgi:hypothetical protein
MGEISVTTCPLCDRPMRLNDRRPGGRGREQLLPQDGLVVEVGFSRNGWGYRDLNDDKALKIRFAEEVCHDCFSEAQTLLAPAVAFLRGERGRAEHDDGALRGHDVAPQGHRAPLLRDVRALLPDRTGS